jgi:hypothetical protein
MKKIYYLLAFTALAFTSCKPLSNTFNELDSKPTRQTIVTYTSTAYASIDAAKTGVVTLLNTKYGDYPDSTTAVVSFPTTNAAPFIADNLLSHNAYTLLAADYTFPGNTTAYLTDAGALNYLNYRYPTPVNYQLAVLTYTYFLTNVTATAGVTTTDSFIYLQGAWVKIYTVSPAQYASVNRGANGFFLTTDASVLTSYFNAFLLNDPIVMATAKIGDVKYVSYKYNTTLQQVLPLTFDGTNWVNKISSNFIKVGGTWVPDPTIYVVLPVGANNPDYIWLRDNTTIGQATARANVVSFGDFNTSPTQSTTTWLDSEVRDAMAAILLHKVPVPIIGIPYKITYSIFPGANPVIAVSRTYKFNGTVFIQQ